MLFCQRFVVLPAKRMLYLRLAQKDFNCIFSYCSGYSIVFCMCKPQMVRVHKYIISGLMLKTGQWGSFGCDARSVSSFEYFMKVIMT